VDIGAFAPRTPEAAAAGVHALAKRLSTAAPGAGRAEDSAFARDHAQAGRALAVLQPGRDRAVAFVGKLMVAKGIDLLLAAWPLVLAREPAARLLVVGFGGYRVAAERLVEHLGAGDLKAARELAERGRAAEGGPAGQLRHLAAFLDGLRDHADRREPYLAAARALPDRVVFTGRLEHDELAELLPACEALVVPSTFPEAFGMVAAEAAACGALPISAEHSGLAEVSRTLAEAVPEQVRGLLSFRVGPGAVEDLAARLAGWLAAPESLRRQTAAALAEIAHQRYSWEGVAEGVIAAAQGRLDDLPRPSP
jgi:glycosyltransferase involved in cell wall biosynthesis